LYTNRKAMQKRNSFISSYDAKSLGRFNYYRMLSDARNGELVMVRRGVYAKPEQLADTMVDIEMLVPGGVLCSFSAWNEYGLTTAIPQAFHVAVKRGRKIHLPAFPAIELHYMSEELLALGVKEMVIHGYHVRMFDVERSVCDAVKFRNRIGQDVCSEVVKSYLLRKDRNIAKLMDYAGKLRVKNTIEKYLEVAL
jgi:predicted transcriptional regulator of viral defense system